MEKKKILYISQEITPYLPETEMSEISRYLPQGVQEKGREIRTFMPRYGSVNERRNQLHEVIRLSGMNLVINDTDHPLIIKVASIPRERMQVYFIENDDYFKRKATYTDEEGILYPDNDEHAIFFAKGVIETVKKLNWSPDIIHVHGWLASFLPVYLKNYYGTEPLFENSKIVTSVYEKGFEGKLDSKVINKIAFDGISEEEINELKSPDYNNVMKVAIKNSDAVIIGSENIPEELENYLKNLDKPVLKFHNKEEFSEAYLDFYTTKVLR